MKERPILMSASMVRAILAGTKTQTRRICKFTSGGHLKGPGEHKRWHPEDSNAVLACPYGAPKSHLWVRETFQWCQSCGSYDYRADANSSLHCRTCDAALGKWRPSIFMPRDASRLTLEIEAVRVDRLQDITEADAVAEGVTAIVTRGEMQSDKTIKPFTISAQTAYRILWNHINGPGSWDLNPWVWVITFRRIAP